MVTRYIYHWISELPQGKDGKQQRQYLDEEKFSNILKYLEESETNSATTETSDSGIRESCSIFFYMFIIICFTVTRSQFTFNCGKTYIVSRVQCKVVTFD